MWPSAPRYRFPGEWSINRFVETPSFTFRRERVKSLHERAEERAQEDLANELRTRMRGEAMLLAATNAASARSAVPT
ncbi:MAG TPA: hypothetical protein VFP78_22305 [Solirubrobacteraceae bacterium]|nr:hypothetical protein [Solirubrobacteraceae bacterium]